MVCANAARIEAAGWNREEIRKSVLDALDDYVRLKPGADSVPPALYVSLTDAVVKTRQTGRVLGVGQYPRVADFDTAPGRHLLLTAGITGPSSGKTEEFALTGAS